MIGVAIGTLLAFAILGLLLWLFQIVWRMADRRQQPPLLWFLVAVIVSPPLAMAGLWLFFPAPPSH